MKQIRGIWLPDAETHLIAEMEKGPHFAGAGTYQLHKLLAALPFVKEFGHAVDVGAHVGLWTRPLALMFDKVTAFEPNPIASHCFKLNMSYHGGRNVILRDIALGEKPGRLEMGGPEDNTGMHSALRGGPLVAAMSTLDAEMGSRPKIDFLKIDTEGFELFVVKGGEASIRRDKPIIVLEQKPGMGAKYGLGETDACRLVASWGAILEWNIGGDFCMRWK